MPERRGSAAERGYGARWRKARLHHLKKHPLCVLCKKAGRVTPATVVDHIEPHRLGDALASGDPVAIAKARLLFWDSSRWQSTCETCHNAVKATEERSGYQPGCDEDGIPLDPNHRWNR